jgi:hypothetical protein
MHLNLNFDQNLNLLVIELNARTRPMHWFAASNNRTPRYKAKFRFRNAPAVALRSPAHAPRLIGYFADLERPRLSLAERLMAREGAYDNDRNESPYHLRSTRYIGVADGRHHQSRSQNPC